MKNVALITGAAGGIGREFARIHAGHGNDVVGVDLSVDGLVNLKTELEKEFGIQVHTIVKDLTDLNAPKQIYDELSTANIEVSYLINNAGFGGVGKFHQRSWAQDLSMIQVDVLALTALTKLYLPDFVSKNRGRILNVSSAVSLVPGPGQAVYFASKAFVTSLTRSIYGELHDSEVSITALLPGATQTGFGNHSGMNKTAIYKRPADAAHVARDGYNAMMKGELEIISGIPFSQRVTIALAPLLPKKMVVDRIRKSQEVNN